MTPTHPAPGVTLFHADCRDVLPTLDGIGAVVTDPPFGIDWKPGKHWGASWAGKAISGDQDRDLRDWIVAWSEDHNIPWAVFGSWKCPRPPSARGILVFDKGPAFGQGDLSFPWKMSYEFIFVGGPGWEGFRHEGVLRGHQVVSWESKGRKHPNQKPVSLIRHLLSKLPPDLIVLDPFAGSGSTLVACMKTGRKAIGIEVDARYVPVIERRCRDASTPLFDPAPSTTEALFP